MTAAAQHAGLSAERWRQFSYDQQVLMIANEMHRSARLIELAAWDRVHAGIERVLRLTDLTIGCVTSPTRRRELLRWRDLIAAMYLEEQPRAVAHEEAFGCLLQFTPTAFEQTSLLMAPRI